MTSDKVRVINNRSSHCFKIGAIVKVVGVCARQYPCSYLCDGTITDGVTGEELAITQRLLEADVEEIN